MKRSTVIAAALTPTIILLLFWLIPAWDISVVIPLVHFYVVTFVTFTTVVVTLLLRLNMDAASPSRHRLLMTAFTLMGAVFFFHGFFTPNAVSQVVNPGLQWGAWLTMLTGGLLFCAAAFDRPERPLAWRQMRGISLAALIFFLTFAGLVLLAPVVLSTIDEVADPLHEQIVFWATIATWLFAAVRFYQIWRQTGHPVDLTMALIAYWLLLGTISLHKFPLWQLSWWLYHFLLLAATLTAIVVLARSYERMRQFRLTRYYVAIGLTLTALVSLIAALLLSLAVENEFLMASDMEMAVIQARRLGLLLTGGAMAALFGILFLVVRRADQLIQARTAELAQAYADLQAAQAMRDDLTSMIVHDLRTPLTGIKLSINLLAQAGDPGRAVNRENMIDRAQASADRMLELINQILDVSKLEAGQFELRRQPIPLAELIAERREAFIVQAEQAEVSLTTTVAADLPQPAGDANLVARILDNLISNALKHTNPDGQVSIAARTENGAILVQVADTGVGIPQTELTRVFEKFGQVRDASGQPIRAGTGLGLPFCRLAVEAHGGRIWVDSDEGAGSTFSFTLPLR